MGDGALSARPPVGLLLSRAVGREHGARIDALAAEAGVALKRCTTPRNENELAAIDMALFSRELFEGSSVRVPGPLSNAFFGFVDAAPNLRWLHVCSSGTDLPQYRPSLERGVRVTSASGSTAVPIAQSVLAAILAQSRGFGHWLNAQRSGQWHPLKLGERPREIAGQRAVVVGAGPIAVEIGRLLGAVGFHTTAVRRRAGATPPFDASCTVDQLDSLLPRCDWLVLACPLTDATHRLVDARRLELLPATARLVNVGRGELLDEAALTGALQAGKLAGAYLDVFWQEPLPAASPLWALPNVWITPHNCAASQGHETRVVGTFLCELGDWLRRPHATRPSSSSRDITA